MADNNGKNFPKATLAATFERFGRTFGGCTIEGPINGIWTADDGTVFRDRLYKLWVVTTDDRLPEARQMAADMGRELGQLAVYTEAVRDDGVEIIKL